MKKSKIILLFIALVVLAGSVWLGLSTYQDIKESGAPENPMQNASGEWELTFRVQVTAFDKNYDGLYISPSGANDWSSNLLSEELLSGQGRDLSFTIDNPTQSLFDVKAVLSDGSTEMVSGVDLTSTEPFALIGKGQTKMQSG
jgi:hypothetical protein